MQSFIFIFFISHMAGKIFWYSRDWEQKWKDGSGLDDSLEGKPMSKSFYSLQLWWDLQHAKMECRRIECKFGLQLGNYVWSKSNLISGWELLLLCSFCFYLLDLYWNVCHNIFNHHQICIQLLAKKRQRETWLFCCLFPFSNCHGVVLSKQYPSCVNI